LKTIILTGATGFLGSYLAKSFVSDGYKVIILKRRRSNLQRLTEIENKVVFYNLEELELSNPFREHGPISVVVHAATCYGRSGETAREIFDANTSFPLKLLEESLRHKVDTFINIDTILDPLLNAYALSKTNFTEWGKLLSESKEIRFMNIKLEHMYGPGDDAKKFTTWIVQRCLNNTPEIDLTLGEQQRDFIFISDVGDAMILLLKHTSKFSLGFHNVDLGSGISISLRDFVEKVHQLTSSKSKLNFGAYEYRKYEIMKSCSNIEQLKALGWKCHIDLNKGLQQMIEFENNSVSSANK
jgi:CDP-paratose synthetase